MKYIATIQGGRGPDVWETTIMVEAATFPQAAKLAEQMADAERAIVLSLECEA